MTGRFRSMSGGFGRRAGPSRPASRDLKPLASLLPLVFRYRGRLAMALLSLIAATAATLVVPVAVRRIIDHGFSDAHPGFIDQYFAVMLLVVAVLVMTVKVGDYVHVEAARGIYMFCFAIVCSAIAGAMLDMWQTDGDGLYEAQIDGAEGYMRGIYHSNPDGSYSVRTVAPIGYTIPMDGPIGEVIGITAVAGKKLPKADKKPTP